MIGIFKIVENQQEIDQAYYDIERDPDMYRNLPIPKERLRNRKFYFEIDSVKSAIVDDQNIDLIMKDGITIVIDYDDSIHAAIIQKFSNDKLQQS